MLAFPPYLSAFLVPQGLSDALRIELLCEVRNLDDLHPVLAGVLMEAATKAIACLEVSCKFRCYSKCVY